MRNTLRFTAFVAGLLLVSACSGGSSERGAAPDGSGMPSATEVAQLDEHRSLGEPVSIDNLTVWPVHTDAPLEIGEFLTLQEAQADGVAAVREVGGSAPGEAPNGSSSNRSGRQVDNHLANGSATVNTLVVENSGDKPILICAGTIVKGGNQDRQIGQDLVIAAGKTVPVGAFCVEQGRWTNVREGVANDGTFAAMNVVAPMKVRTNAQYEKDQGKVWEEVAAARVVAYRMSGGGGESTAARRLAFEFEADPQADDIQVQTASFGGGTSFVDALEKADGSVQKARSQRTDAIRAHFAELAGDDAPIGFAYAINGKPVTVRVFAHHRLLEQNLDPFLNAMALEAEAAEEQEFTPCTAHDVVTMVNEINVAAEQREETKAANWNGLRQNDRGFNGNCYFGDGDAEDAEFLYIPVTQDWTSR